MGVHLALAEKWELYNVQDDPSELISLVAEYPDKVQALSDQWEKWAERVGVFPKNKKSRKKSDE